MIYSNNPRANIQALIPADATRVLDIGCNTGAFGSALKATRNIEVWGVEPNRKAASEAASHLDRVISCPMSRDLPIPDHYFDVVVFNDVLEHLVDPWDALRIAADKLRASGVVLASIPNLLQFDNLLHMLVERDFRYECLGIRDRTHLRFFTRLSALRLFRESGYQVRHIEGINETWWRPSPLRRLLFWTLGSTLLFEARFNQYAIVAEPDETSRVEPLSPEIADMR